MRILSFIFVILAQLAWFPAAYGAESAWLKTDFAKVRLISASETAGTSDTLSLGLEIILEDKWKTYWRTPGDAGLPTEIFLDPVRMAGAEADLLYPLPKRFSLFGLDTFGYGERVILPINLRLGASYQASAIAMMVEMLVCSDICVPVSGKLSLSLPEGPQIPSIYAQELAKIRAMLPKERQSGVALYLASSTLDPQGQGHLRAIVDDDALADDTLAVNDILIEGLTGASFAASERLSDGSYLLKHNGGAVKPAIGDEVRVLVDRDANSFETALSIQSASLGTQIQQPLQKQAQQSQTLPFWLIALIGGFILNFMPCVLPVISLKLASVISLGGAGLATIRARFLMSAAGIISSFILLAFALQMLRLAGGQIGWGIQFQSPIFLGALLVVTGIFTLSLFGLVHLRLPQFIQGKLSYPDKDDKGLWGDFGAGMLATLLATPCSAPFVGTAVSFALAQSDMVLYGMLVMMGIGLALPWLFFALAPQMIRLLPRPGKWMVTMQNGLGVLMALTVLWVGSLFYNAITANADDAKEINDSAWLVYEEGELARLIADGRLVFVDVTADWCITCKANKALVLDTKAVEKLFASTDIVLMRADWTLPDDAIAQYLASYQRYGIPFNIIYGPSARQGLPLPEILTQKAIENALKQANQ